MTQTIDLGELTNGGAVPNLSGKSRGLAAMKAFELDWDSNEDIHEVLITAPSYIDSITPSFIQGMLSSVVSAINSDPEKFNQLVKFNVSEPISAQISMAVRALFTSRDFTSID